MIGCGMFELPLKVTVREKPAPELRDLVVVEAEVGARDGAAREAHEHDALRIAAEAMVRAFTPALSSTAAVSPACTT